MDEKEVYAEIEGVIERALSSADAVVATWVAHEVLSLHPIPDCDEHDFIVLATGKYVRDAVHRVLNKYKLAEEDPDDQMLLQGFKRICKKYSVERDGEQCVVKFKNMTSAECREKARSYRKTGTGLYEHADELDNWADALDAKADTASA